VPRLAQTIDLLITFAGFILQGILLFLVIRKRVHRELFFLAAYIILLLPRELVGRFLYYTPYFNSAGFRYFYYGSEGFLYLLRLFLIVEIARRVLRGYPAVWHLARKALVLVGLACVGWTTYFVIRHHHFTKQFVLTIQQFYSFAEPDFLLLVLAIGLYYRIQVPRLHRSIFVGICFFSAVQIVNSEFGRYIASPTLSAYDFVGRSSFVVMMAIWTASLWKWSPAPPQPTQLISQSKYDDLSPQVHDRLRELNDRLAGLRKRK
jgi:hypothetical protein